MSPALLIRHGQSVANAQRIWQGHADYPLSERGRLEAEAVASAISSLGVRYLWTSPLQRAAQTALAIGAATGLAPTYDARLMEIDVGAASGLTADQVHQRFPERATAMADGRRWAFPGQEEPEAFEQRILAALEDMLAPDELVVAVTHGGVIGRIVAEVLGIDRDRAWPFSIGNCSVTEVVRERRGGLALKRLNDACHLEADGRLVGSGQG